MSSSDTLNELASQCRDNAAECRLWADQYKKDTSELAPFISVIADNIATDWDRKAASTDGTEDSWLDKNRGESWLSYAKRSQAAIAVRFNQPHEQIVSSFFGINSSLASTADKFIVNLDSKYFTLDMFKHTMTISPDAKTKDISLIFDEGSLLTIRWHGQMIQYRIDEQGRRSWSSVSRYDDPCPSSQDLKVFTSTVGGNGSAVQASIKVHGVHGWYRPVSQ